jgi:hypothetical protein
MMRGMSRNFAAAGAGPVFPTQTLLGPLNEPPGHRE